VLQVQLLLQVLEEQPPAAALGHVLEWAHQLVLLGLLLLLLLG